MCDLVDVDRKSPREECQDKLWFKAFEVSTNQNNQLNTFEVVCETMCDKEVLHNRNEANWGLFVYPVWPVRRLCKLLRTVASTAARLHPGLDKHFSNLPKQLFVT